MTKKKVFQLVLLGILLIFLLLSWLLDANRYKTNIEAILSQQLQQDVRIGQIKHSLFSPSQLGVEQFVIGDKQKPLLSLQSLQLELELWPLLWREVEVEKLILNGLVLDASLSEIEKLKSAEGSKDTNQDTEARLAIKSLRVKALAINKLEFSWSAPGQTFNIQQGELTLQQMLLVDDWQLLADTSTLQLTAAIAQMSYNNLDMKRLKLKAELGQGRFVLQELALGVFSGSLSVKGSTDLANDFATTLAMSIDGMQLDLTPEWLQQFSPPTEVQPDRQEKNPNGKLPLRSLLLSAIEVKNTQLQTSLSSPAISAKDIQLKLENVRLIHEYQLDRIQQGQQTSLQLNLLQPGLGQHLLDTVSLRGLLAEQKLDLTELTVMAPGLDVQLQAQADLRGKNIPVHIQSKKVELSFDETTRHWFKDDMPWLQGQLSASAQISLPVLAPQPANNLAGELKLKSQDMRVHKLNLNGILAGLEQTEKTSLLDVGSFVVTGPLGLIATQVANLGQTGLTAQDGQSLLKQLNLDIAIDKGVLSTRDVALSTDKYRVALDGNINLAQKQFEDLKFYILDDKGCADIQQTLNGPMDSPDGIFSQAVSTTVLKPFSNILTQAGDLLSKCKPVYQGEVGPP